MSETATTRLMSEYDAAAHAFAHLPATASDRLRTELRTRLSSLQRQIRAARARAFASVA